MLVDSYGRKINYLRISLTQQCNFRCLYCMPNTPFDKQPNEQLLSIDELFLFVRVAIDEGVSKIRLTGGEPLVRRDLAEFIKMINDYKKDIDLALTTNGFLLAKQAAKLKDAGLKRVNISLDTLIAKRAKKLQNKDCLNQVLAGIEEARKNDFKIKLNTVALKGINDDELVDLLDFARKNGAMIRYIEFMENSHAYGKLKGLNKEEILKLINQKYKSKESEKEANSPASLYELEDGYKFGIIDPHSHDFCDTCNRLRLSAEGLLIPCLYFDEALSIKKAVRKGDIKAAAEILREVIRQKPEKNRWENDDKNEISSRAFYETGG